MNHQSRFLNVSLPFCLCFFFLQLNIGLLIDTLYFRFSEQVPNRNSETVTMLEWTCPLRTTPKRCLGEASLGCSVDDIDNVLPVRSMEKFTVKAFLHSVVYQL